MTGPSHRLEGFEDYAVSFCLFSHIYIYENKKHIISPRVRLLSPCSFFSTSMPIWTIFAGMIS